MKEQQQQQKIQKEKQMTLEWLKKKSQGREGLEFQSRPLCGPEQTAESLCISDPPTIRWIYYLTVDLPG